MIKIRRIRCVSCGNTISKSALHDPYMCRDCESEMDKIERYAHLDEEV